MAGLFHHHLRRDAAGRGDKWYNATGWCCYTSVGQTEGDRFANYLCQAAIVQLIGVNVFGILLIVVWLPALIISIRKAWKETKSK